MAKRSKSTTLATALALLWLAPAALWAEPPAERAAERKRAEAKIEKLSERLAVSQPTRQGGWQDNQLTLAAAQLKLARKLLARSNVRAAEVLAGQAERALARAEDKEARQ